MMKNILKIILLLLCCTSNLYADETMQHGFYGELSLGRGYTNFSADNFTNHPTYNDDTWTWASRAALGFNIDDYLGVEIGGRYFEQRKFSNLQNSGNDGYVNEHAYDAQTVIHWPVNKIFNLYGKFGPAYVVAHQAVKAVDGATIDNNLMTNKIAVWQPTYALGTSIALNALPGLSAMFEYSVITGNEDKHLPQSEMYLVGLIFNFA